MTAYKNNHYVPQMLQKRFLSNKHELFYYNKDEPSKPIQHRNPKSIFCKRDLYVDIDKAGKRDVTLESEVYSKLDNEADQVINKIVVATRKSELPQLSPDEKSIWDQFLFQQWQRTPDAQIDFDKTYDFDGEYSQSIAEYEQTIRPLNSLEKKEFQDPLEKKEFAKVRL